MQPRHPRSECRPEYRPLSRSVEAFREKWMDWKATSASSEPSLRNCGCGWIPSCSATCRPHPETNRLRPSRGGAVSPRDWRPSGTGSAALPDCSKTSWTGWTFKPRALPPGFTPGGGYAADLLRFPTNQPSNPVIVCVYACPPPKSSIITKSGSNRGVWRNTLPKWSASSGGREWRASRDTKIIPSK